MPESSVRPALARRPLGPPASSRSPRGGSTTRSRVSRTRSTSTATRLDLARTLRALGERGAAVAEAAEARAAFEELCAEHDAATAGGFVGQGRANGPLTRRELQVIALVAAGRSNREIAEQLVVSEHTVHRHVANILRKLGEPTRAAAAARATRDGLV